MVNYYTRIYYKKAGNSCIVTREFNPPAAIDMYMVEEILKQEEINEVFLTIEYTEKTDLEQKEDFVLKLIRDYPNVHLGGMTKSNSLISINGKMKNRHGYLTYIAINEEDVLKMTPEYAEEFGYYYILQEDLTMDKLKHQCKNIFKHNRYTIIPSYNYLKN